MANQRLSFGQLQSLWIQAGGDAASAPSMAAIAIAESGGNTQSANNTAGEGGPTDGITGSYGLWQINNAHVEALGGPGWFAPCSVPYGSDAISTTAGAWGDPMSNARAAVAVKGSQGLGAWTTWTNGSAKKILAQNGGTPASSGDWLQNLENGVGNFISGAEQDVANAFGVAWQALFGGWVSPFLRLPQSLINIGWNFGGFSIGVMLIGLGALLLFASVFESIAADVMTQINDTTNAGEPAGQTSAVANVAKMTAEGAIL